MKSERIKKREAYNSLAPNQFLNEETGAFKQLNKSSWFIKKKPDGKVGYYLNMDSKFQQMPDACFRATTEGSKMLDIGVIKSEIKQFMEAANVQK